MSDPRITATSLPTPREPPEPPEDLGDAKQVRDREKRLKARREALAAVYRQIMATSDGRAWMRHLLTEKLCLGRALFTGNNATFANVGMHDVGRQIEAEVKAYAFDQWVLMEREAIQSNRERRNARSDDDDSGSDE